MEDDPNLAVATVVDTPERLEQLFKDKFVYWEYAGFASVLVQRRADLRLLVAEHRSGFAPKTDRQITSIDELDQLVADMERELVRVGEGLGGHTRSASVRHVMGRESVTPEEVTAAAATIIDFYRDLLLLAKNTQAVVAPDDYREIIKDTAHLIDKPMEGIDQFITDWVGLVAMLPTLDGESYCEYHFHSIELTFEVDDDLLHRIHRGLKSRRQPWRRWLSPSAPRRREADAERQRQAAAAEAERQRQAAAAEAERQRQAAERQRQAAEQLRLKRQRAEAEEERLRQEAAAESERLWQEAAAEAERRHTWQLSRWPKGTTLDSHIAQIDGFVPQVAAQNEKIESQVQHLNDLLRNGLREQPQGKPTAPGRAGDPKGITEHIELTLAAVQLGTEIPKARVAYSPQSRQLVVEYELPTVDVVPKAKSYHYVKSQDKVVETARPASQVKGLYASAIAQLTLLCLARIFRVDTEQHIDVVVFNGVVDTIDLRTGKPIRPCLITVRTTRDTFSEIDLDQVDPVACLKYLNAGISRSPTELAPVRPVLEFSMVDPRFITETDTLGALDNRPNLMELTPQQFESLIQNLFDKIGLDTRLTRPSRDGGVDCVAYNTDPILGGKVVIQAKRYKNTVGVSAVRDLYGTLQNEGASKGILVTTSGYGKASYDFAEGKPIELFDGTNLLYLLETHAGIKARIEPPDDWQDPVPDSGEVPIHTSKDGR